MTRVSSIPESIKRIVRQEAGFGFDLISESVSIGTDEISEKVAKIRTKSYQANIYDFKERYKTQITKKK